MFTINQIKEAHAKVKSGADFPKYVQDLMALGVTDYSSYVSDGHTVYSGKDEYRIDSGAKYAAMEVAPKGDTEKLKYALSIHQQGQTDYPTFCRQSAEAGVEKWIVDMTEMTCVYYDKAGHKMVTESIPYPA